MTEYPCRDSRVVHVYTTVLSLSMVRPLTCSGRSPYAAVFSLTYVCVCVLIRDRNIQTALFD